MNVLGKCVAVAEFIDWTRVWGWEGVGGRQDIVDSKTIMKWSETPVSIISRLEAEKPDYNTRSSVLPF